MYCSGEVAEQVVAVAILARLAEGGAVARDARAHGFGNRGKGHGKARDAAVGLNHLDIQIAVVGGAIEVVDDEGTGSDGGFVDLLRHLLAKENGLAVYEGDTVALTVVGCDRLRDNGDTALNKEAGAVLP